MANTVKIKRSAVSGKVPGTADLQLGELALNTFDGKLYTKKDNGTASIIEVGAGGTGTVTSVSGTGTVSGLTLTGSVTTAGSLTLGGTLSLTSANVTTALGYTPYNATNPSGYITSSALTPYALLSGAAFTGTITTTGLLGVGTSSPTAIGGYGTITVDGTTGSFTDYRQNGTNRLRIGGDNGAGFINAPSGTLRLLTNDADRLTINSSGSVTAAVDVRAPIFYDSNDTSRYVDPNFTTNLNSLVVANRIDGSIGGDAQRLFNHIGANNDGLQYWNATNNTTLNPNTGYHYGLRMGHGDADTYYSATLAVDFFADNFYLRRKTGGTDQTWRRFWHNGDSTISATGDFRAPIFYDSDNTAYYLDLTSSTSLNAAGSLVASGNITLNNGANRRVRIGSATNYSYDLQTTGDDFQIIEAGTTPRLTIKYPNGFVGIGTASPLANVHVVGAAMSTGVNPPAGTQILSHAGGFDAGTFGASLNFTQQWFSGAPTSLISVGQIVGLKTSGNGNFGGGLAFFVGPSGAGSSTLLEAMRIDGNAGGAVTAFVDVRAPIFYDSGNTGYYVDPASTSNLNALNVNGSAVYRSDWTTRFQSPSDFVDGTLVTTDIPATGWAGDSFVIEITGKTYDQNNPPVKVIAQGYLYNDTIINYSGISYAGNFASYVKVFQDGGVLKFWWPRISYWNSFNVNVMSMDGQTNGTITRNRVTAIGNSTEPTGTKKVQINLTKTLKTGDAAGSISGFNNPTTAPTANTIAYRDAAGDISAREIVLSSGLSGSTPTVLVSMFPATNQLVRTTPAAVATAIQGAASGSWGISVTGNAATATKATDLNQARYVNTDFNTLGTSPQVFRAYSNYIPSGGSYNQPAAGGQDFKVLQWGDVEGGSSGNWGGQIVQNFYDDRMWFRRSYGTTWQAWREFIHDGNVGSFAMRTNASATNSVDVRAPIFYDSNNTSFYVDPQGGSAFQGALIVGPNTSGKYTRFGGNGGAADISTVSTSNGNLHIDAETGSNIYLAWYNGSTVQVGGGIAATIYYDRDNTGYYIDANSTSRTGMINADNLRTQNNVYIDQQYGSSLIGAYNSTRYQGVYAMGDAYKLAIDGTTAGNLYGIAWAHPNAGGVAANLNTHGALFLENGGFLAAVSGSIRCRDDMRTPIFYDSDNTAFYINPNSTSNVSAMVSYSYQGNGNVGGTGSASWHPSGIYSAGYNWLYGGISAGNADISSVNNLYAAAYYDNNNTAYYVNPASGSNLDNLTIRKSGVSLATGNSRQLEINNAGSGACNISFHREGAYGAHFGLDTDNVFKTYGWSAGGGFTAMEVGNFTANGSITATGNVTAYSDIRIKANIETIPSALDKLDRIRGVTYTRTDLDDKEQRYAGVIAQEIEAVLPEAVRNLGDIKAVDYNATIGLLIQAVKELRDELETLRNRS